MESFNRDLTDKMRSISCYSCRNVYNGLFVKEISRTLVVNPPAHA